MIALALAAVLLAQGLPGPVPPPNITIQNQVTVQAPPPDPQAISDASVQSSQAILATVVAPVPVQWAQDLCRLPDLWRTTPAGLTFENGDVRSVAGIVSVAAWGLLAALIFVAGLGHALGQGASLGRLLFALVLSAGNLSWWQIGIGANNAVTQTISAPDLCAHAQGILGTKFDQTSAPAAIVLVVVYAIVLILLLFTLLFRLGFIDILIAAGPLGLMMYALPQTSGFASMYTRLAAGFLFSQIPIVIGIRLAQVVGGVAGGVTGTLLGIVVLLVVRQIPGLLISGRTGRGPEVLAFGFIAAGARRMIGLVR